MFQLLLQYNLETREKVFKIICTYKVLSMSVYVYHLFVPWENLGEWDKHRPQGGRLLFNSFLYAKPYH